MNTSRKHFSRRILRASLAVLALAAGAAALTPALAILDAPRAQAKVLKRYLRVPLNKSAIVRLPRDAADVLIGGPNIADAVLRSRRMVYIFARHLGQTDMHFLDAAGRPILSLDVEVSKDIANLQKLINRVLPHSHIRVERVEDQILLTGVARTVAEATTAMDLASRFIADAAQSSGGSGGKKDVSGKVINAMTVSGKDQVTLKVKIAEVQRDVAKQLGINWNKVLHAGSVTTQVLMGNPFSLGQSLGSSVGSGLIANSTLSNLGMGSRGIGVSKGTTGMVLRAMERDGLMRLLAEPTLTAVSGEAAKFLAGGEVPIVTNYSADSGYTYTMKPFGVALGFTPLVLSEGRISLKINTEVSEISNKYSMPVGALAVPGFETRRTETTVELPSGGTLVIGGLIRQQTKQNIDGFPALKNLPVLGALFRSRDYQSNETELVVMVTPYIVNPVNEKKLRTPLDRLNIASDQQTIFLGRLHKVYGAPAGEKGEGLVYHGDVGFIVE